MTDEIYCMGCGCSNGKHHRYCVNWVDKSPPESNRVFVPQKSETEILLLTKVDVELALNKDKSLFDRHGISLDNPRFGQLNKSRRCKCCDIKITHAFVEYNEQNKCDVICFYAQTKNKADTDKEHYILMVQNDQYGTLCIMCSFALTEFKCTLAQLQQGLFNCYRIYRGTIALRKKDEKLLPETNEVNKLTKMIENIQAGIPRVSNPDTVTMMELKIDRAVVRIKELKALIETERTKAQQTGEV